MYAMRMTITWTNDIIGSTTKKMARNDELDSQSIHTENNLESKTWTYDIIGGTTKMARNHELDSQSIHTENNLESKTWTYDIIGGTTKMARNHELDSQSIHIKDYLDSKTRSVGKLSNGCNSICNTSLYEITHSRVQELTKENMELKSKLNCFICRQNLFSDVLIPCGHLVCGNCVKLTCCCCSSYIETYHPCTLPSFPDNTGHTVSFSSSIATSDAFYR